MLDTMILFNFTFEGQNIPTKNKTRTKTVYENRKISTCTSIINVFTVFLRKQKTVKLKLTSSLHVKVGVAIM